MFYHVSSIYGRRDYNEDEYDIMINLNNKNKEKHICDYFSIFDGHGGGFISKYLKKNFQYYFTHPNVQYPSKSKEYNKYIIKVCELIQNKLCNYELQSKITGSTALTIIIYEYKKKKMLKVINLGDCRAIACNLNNIAIPLTKDHKPTSYEEFHRITELNGNIIIEKNDDPRINGMSVSRSFGDLDAKPHVSHIPDIFDYDIDNFSFIVLACDGLWDVLSNQEVVDFILYQMKTIKIKNETSNKSLNNIAVKLVDYAYDKGTQDNITAIIFFL